MQVLLRNDKLAVEQAISLISAKILNQAALLKYYKKYRKRVRSDDADALAEGAGRIADCASGVKLIDPSEPTARSIIMGYEGKAAAVYWKALGDLFFDAFGFQGRIGRGASDIVNQCLNYGYSLLYCEVWKAIATTGLDPYFGIVHSSQRDNGSMVFDLIEEFRTPVVDKMIVGMFNRGFVPKTSRDNRLSTQTKRYVINGFTKRMGKRIKWRSKALDMRSVIRIQAQSMASFFLSGKPYRPFKFRW
jgi:CRISPR-associated protein Cas1